MLFLQLGVSCFSFLYINYNIRPDDTKYKNKKNTVGLGRLLNICSIYFYSNI